MKKLLFPVILIVMATFSSATNQQQWPPALPPLEDTLQKAPAPDIELPVASGEAKVSCKITVDIRYRNRHNRCPRNTVVTSVQILSGGIALLDCAKLRVDCS